MIAAFVTRSATRSAIAFPWIESLPARDRRCFVDEFSSVVVAAAAVDNDESLDRLVREWRAMAEVHADPKLAQRLRRPSMQPAALTP